LEVCCKNPHGKRKIIIMSNEFQENMPDTKARTKAEGAIDLVRNKSGIFVEAVRMTRMPMLVTDSTLPGNPIVFANEAFVQLCGYSVTEMLGQDPHFMNGKDTDEASIRKYEESISHGREEALEILQYHKDGTPFNAMLFSSVIKDDAGKVTNHFLSYLDITRRVQAEQEVALLIEELEVKVKDRTAELEKVVEELKKVDAERSTLVVEVNHRAKNSLGVASALLSLQARRQSDPAIKELFQQSQDRIAAMAKVHDMLSQSQSGNNIDLSKYVDELCNALRPIIDNESHITLGLNNNSLIMVNGDIAFSLGIAITELITNAVKYAFPKPKSGMLLVSTQKLDDNKIEVIVQDNGVGYKTMRENSLGLGLVRSLVNQIDGTLDIVNDGGVKVTIQFNGSR
jgi:PAS domain S-box-containing protein